MDWSTFPREKTDCILCGSNSFSLLSTQMTWPVVRCRNCGFVYLAERPSETELAGMYSRSYYEDGDVGYRGYVSIFEKYHDTFMRIFRRRHRDLIKRASGRRLLEVGCAYGFLLDFLRSKDWEVTGIEISPLSSAYARDQLHLNVHTGSVKSVNLPPESFDVILLLDVLEHLHRPYDTLRHIRSLLAPDGILVVQCPWELFHWEKVAEARFKRIKPGTIKPDAVPAHLYFFQPSSLEGILRKAGFRIIGRQSGNYGAIRRLVDPPCIGKGNIFIRLFRYVYFRMGLQRLLYLLARLTGFGNGIIRYAIPSEECSDR